MDVLITGVPVVYWDTLRKPIRKSVESFLDRTGTPYGDSIRVTFFSAYGAASPVTVAFDRALPCRAEVVGLVTDMCKRHAETANEASLLYAVYLQDTNGHRRLVGGGMDLSESEARGLIEKIVGSHTKPHKVDYDLAGYTPQTKVAVLAEKEIAY